MSPLVAFLVGLPAGAVLLLVGFGLFLAWQERQERLETERWVEMRRRQEAGENILNGDRP